MSDISIGQRTRTVGDAPIVRVESREVSPSTERLEAPSHEWLTLCGPDSGVPQHKRDWARLSVDEHGALTTLGWNEQSWAAVRAGSLAALPDAARTSHSALAADQRAAIATLGIDAKSWDEGVALRGDILNHPKLIAAVAKLRAQGLPIEAADVRATILPAARTMGVATPSAKRALLYILDFHGHLFSEAARQALRDDVSTYSALDIAASGMNPNLGWTAAIAPEPRLGAQAEGSAPVINDASGRSATLVRDIVYVQSPDDVRDSILRARALGTRISIAGRRHSMGAQSASPGSINLDMMGLNRMAMTAQGTLRVETGATWAQVVHYLGQQNPPLAPKTMQDYDPFTVGGSVSVNIHGRTPGLPPFISTVRSLRIMTADGEVVCCSRTENSELFRHAVGGYGLFGVILDVELEVTKNVPVRLHCEVVPEAEFARRFSEAIARPDTELCWGRMDPTFASREVILHTASRADSVPEKSGIDYERLQALRKVEQWVLQMSKQGTSWLEMRWLLEKWLRKNDAVGLRSELLALKADGLRQLWFNEGKESAILQEYFVPAAKMQEFTDGLRAIRTKHGDVVAATLRDVPQDSESALPFAKHHSIAFVLYCNQELSERGYAKSGALTRDLIDLALACGGTFYLPYQLHYSPQQLRSAYPEVDDFFAAKRRFDPDGMFSNAWYEKYAG